MQDALSKGLAKGLLDIHQTPIALIQEVVLVGWFGFNDTLNGDADNLARYT